MKKTLLAVSCIVILSSCGGKNSSEYKQLQAQNDSLKLEATKTTSELNDMLSLLNDVEDNFKKIREAENYLTIQQNSNGEMSKSVRERVMSDVQLITETLQKNKEQLAKLQDQLKNSNFKSAQLQKTVDRLSNELNQKTALVTSLQDELSRKNIRIKELDEAVTTLTVDNESLTVKNTTQASKIKDQDKEINTAYYCFGTSKELKDQKIITGGGLFSKSKTLDSDFNKEYFMAIDIRKVTEIPLFAKKAKLKTNHPDGTYEFVKDEDGNLTFKITNPKEFWSISKFLVIEVN